MLKIERYEYIYGNLSAKKCNYTLYILYLKNVFPYNISILIILAKKLKQNLLSSQFLYAHQNICILGSG